jgi:ubiquinone/menaquinone biosynthesis C-methylase UbiE
MSMPREPSQKRTKNTYVLETGGAAEMARLMRQDQLLTQGMGGILPEKPDLSQAKSILDLACGPGGWALETAYTYAGLEVVGVDISENMVSYANAQARAQLLSNAHFEVMNILQPLAFPDGAFDLVNARYTLGFMRSQSWPGLIQECLRVLRPGGILRFTEFEWGGANKPHFEKALFLLSLTMHKAGYGCSPSGHYLGVLPMLPRWFQEAGLQNVRTMAHTLNFSAGTEARDGFYYNHASAFQTLTPFVIRYGIASEEEWKDLYQKGLAEMYLDDFCAMWILLTVWGTKLV